MIVEHVSVLGHVSRRVKEVLKVPKEFLVFAGHLLPCSSQSRHWSQVQPTVNRDMMHEKEYIIYRIAKYCRLPEFTAYTPNDGKHGAEVLALPAVQSNFDEMLYSLHAFELIGLPRHLCGHPEGLVVDGLLKTLQAGRAQLRSQLKQVVDVLCGLDGAE